MSEDNFFSGSFFTKRKGKQQAKSVTLRPAALDFIIMPTKIS